MRRSIAALCLVAVALLPACSRNKPPNSLFDSAGYYVRADKVYYLSAFPGKASEIAGADTASFKAFDTTYAKDKSNAYFDGQPIPGADATSFDVLDRTGFAKDRNHVYQLDRPISGDPAHFQLLDGGLSKDSTAVYWTDGGVLYFKDRQLRASYTASNGLAEGHVAGLQLDGEGALWAATEGGGVSQLKDGHIATLTSRNGRFSAIYENDDKESCSVTGNFHIDCQFRLRYNRPTPLLRGSS